MRIRRFLIHSSSCFLICDLGKPAREASKILELNHKEIGLNGFEWDKKCKQADVYNNRKLQTALCNLFAHIKQLSKN